MKHTLAALPVLVVIITGAGCWVSTRSADYACNDDADCAEQSENRACDTTVGYCVRAACPRACDSCNVATKVCTIGCAQGSTTCGSLTCPAGYTCNVTCTGNNACGTITCGDAVDCNVTCSGGNMNNPACGSVACGGAPCDVTCATTYACGDIDCNDSCACDVSCGASLACASTTCQAGCEQTMGCSSELSGCTSTCP